MLVFSTVAMRPRGVRCRYTLLNQERLQHSRWCRAPRRSPPPGLSIRPVRHRLSNTASKVAVHHVQADLVDSSIFSAALGHVPW